MSLDFPLLVWLINLFFLSQRGERGRVFAVFFCPLSREGNSGLHSTPSNYSSFYCSSPSSHYQSKMRTWSTWLAYCKRFADMVGKDGGNEVDGSELCCMHVSGRLGVSNEV